MQYQHLEAELRLVHSQLNGPSMQPSMQPRRMKPQQGAALGAAAGGDALALWGQIMWKAYYDSATMSTSTGFSGWETVDWAAVAQRRSMLHCILEANSIRTRRCIAQAPATGVPVAACEQSPLTLRALKNMTERRSLLSSRLLDNSVPAALQWRLEAPACAMLKQSILADTLKGHCE